MTKSTFVLGISAILACLITPNLAEAYNPNYLVSDAEMEDTVTMSPGEIQSFLNSRGVLGYRDFIDVDGVSRTAGDIIWRVSQSYQLSPWFLMALLQREQSLIEASILYPKQLDWAMGYARCDSCDPNHPLVIQYKGFAKQVEGAADRIRNHYLKDIDETGSTQSGHGPGITKLIDGIAVTPVNKATAVLYTYTPHLHGNENFTKIWKHWFSRSLPDGTVIRVDDDFYLIQDGKSRMFASASAYLSRYRIDQAVTITNEELGNYIEGRLIKFPNYSLLRIPTGGIYLLDYETVRPIISYDVFKKIGFNVEEVIDISEADLEIYNNGVPITMESRYPTGALIQNAETGGVYWVKDGLRHPIWSAEVMRVRFPKRPVTPVNPSQLEGYELGVPIKFPDGTLVAVKGNPFIYVISNGKKRHIASEEAFLSMNWSFSQVVWTSDSILKLHPLGETFDVDENVAEVHTATENVNN